jgi:hypothetical protein
MRMRRRGDGAEQVRLPEQDLVIDLRERLAPYELERVGDPRWRDTLIAADLRRHQRSRSLRTASA